MLINEMIVFKPKPLYPEFILVVFDSKTVYWCDAAKK